MGSVIPKEIKYDLYYGEARGDVLRPQHGDTVAMTNIACKQRRTVTEELSWNGQQVQLLGVSLRKQAYSNLLKILPPNKKENFQTKILIFSIFLLKT